jgi:hypothetical protein
MFNYCIDIIEKRTLPCRETGFPSKNLWPAATTVAEHPLGNTPTGYDTATGP